MSSCKNITYDKSSTSQ